MGCMKKKKKLLLEMLHWDKHLLKLLSAILLGTFVKVLPGNFSARENKNSKSPVH